MYKILHLETSMLYKTLIKELAAEINAVYFNASSGKEAFKILEDEKISMILTAMELEGGNSPDFIADLNNSGHKNIPVVVITGNDSLEDRKKMYELGIVDYILKSTPRDVMKENLLSYRKKDNVSPEMKKLTYAVLDDSLMDRKIIGRIFAMQGITGADFYDSGQALLQSEKQYDVYIVDLILKDTSGDKVINELKVKSPGSVLIAVSGIDNVKTISRVLAEGASDYLAKPFNHELFIARLKTNVRSYLLLKEVMDKRELLEKMAVTDELTGLFNRRHIFRRVSDEAEKNQRYNSNFSIVMLDIDKFKSINDTYGHPHGDMVLNKVSESIRKSIRAVDIAGRYGGEEFLVILPEVGVRGAAAVAERIRVSVESLKDLKDDMNVTISGGIAEYAGSIEETIKKADLLLYKAKEEGRNRIIS